MVDEIWKDVPPEFLAIEVSNTGKARWKRSGKPVAEYLTKTGYRCANIKPKIHQLIAASFLGMPPTGMVVNHKDLDKQNNRPGNLEYTTPEDNTRHSHACRARGMRPKKHPKRVPVKPVPGAARAELETHLRGCLEQHGLDVQPHAAGCRCRACRKRGSVSSGISK